MKIRTFFIISILMISMFQLYAEDKMLLIPDCKVIVGLSERQLDFIDMCGGISQKYLNATSTREVFVDAFYIDKYEVTNKEYAEFDKTYKYLPSKANYPVVNITYYQAQEYALWKGKRLPTEIEWEAAARGELGRLFPWGESIDITKCRSKEIKMKNDRTSNNVKAFPGDKSPFGVIGMAGNVSEWTSSNYLKYKNTFHKGRNYSKRYKVIKGGSFLYPFFDSICASRRAAKPDTKNINIGMRLVMDVKEYKKRNVGNKH